MNEIQTYNNEQFGTVRTVTVDGEPWFCGKDVLKALEYSEGSMSNLGTVFGAVPDQWKDRKPFTTSGGVQEILCISEQGLYFFLGRSNKSKALPYQMWIAGEVIPSIRKTGSYGAAVGPKPYSLMDEFSTLEVAARMLNMNDAGKILMMNTWYKVHGLPTGFLPKYELNGGKQLIAATTLLKKFGIGKSAVQFNHKMIEKGYMEVRTRESSKGVKNFKALTDAASKYGENVVAPQNPHEVQPVYYEDTFVALCEELFGTQEA